MNVKAIIFDWGRTLFDSETKQEFPEAEQVLELCQQRGFWLAVVSLVSEHSNANLEERTAQIEGSPLRRFFEMVAVTDQDKDKALDETVNKLALPREQILIVDDRTVYELPPEAKPEAYPPILEAGANIVGACCGSTPEHIRRIADVVRARCR